MRLVICDDHQLLLEGLTSALTRAGHQVLVATNDPATAVDAVREHRPDACLLDLHFPDRDGLSVIAELGAAHPGTRVVILSATAQPVRVAEAVGKGAHGFVGKQRPLADIVTTLERAVAGPADSRSAGLRVRRGGPADPGWVLRFLTDREWQVLRCILDGQSTEEIAVELGVRRSTARTHVQNLLTKLGLHSRLQVAAMVNAHGEAVMRTGVWEAS